MNKSILASVLYLIERGCYFIMKLNNYYTMQGYLIVQGNCQICKERIEKAALSVKGVNSANWNIPDGHLNLSFDADMTSLNEISMAIAQVGHETNLHKANKNIQEKLQECCKPIK